MRPIAARLIASLFAAGVATLIAGQAMMVWAPVDPRGTLNWPMPEAGLSADHDPGTLARRSAALGRIAELRALAGRIAPDHFRRLSECAVYVSYCPGRTVDTAAFTAVLEGPGTPPEPRKLLEVRAGWPFRCLAAHGIPTLMNARQPWFDAWPAPAWLRPTDLPTTTIASGLPPCRPIAHSIILPGLLAGTATAGAALFTILQFHDAARRALRRRRDRCPACGYDRRGLAAGAPCPECGPGAG